MKLGDYIAASKYSDGDLRDPWCVGFLQGWIGERFLVMDGDGILFRQNGFRRVKKITREEGAYLLRVCDTGCGNIWVWLRSFRRSNKGRRRREQ